MAKILKQNGVNIGQNRLFAELRELGFLIKRKGSDWNMPTQKSMELGLFEMKETVISHADGHTSINKTVKVTGTGQQYFIHLFLQAVSESLCATKAQSFVDKGSIVHTSVRKINEVLSHLT